MARQVSNEIFEGPPGTGKTVRAKRRAVEIIDGSASADLSEMSARFRDLVALGRIFAPTLHPSYGYPDWVEGYRPLTTEAGDLRWTITPGVLLRAVNACGSAGLYESYFRPGDTITSSTNTSYDVVNVEPGRVTLRRHDQRRNLRSAMDDVYFKDVERCEKAGVEPRELSNSGADVENRDRRAAVAARLEWSPTKLTNSGGLRAVYEHVLLSRVNKGPQSIVLMIDEINRADPGRLWGEVLSILEPNRRAGQPEEQPVLLQFSGAPLTLPSELHIIGTMNTADRSTARFDAAYRRRFEFIFVPPDPMLLEVYGGVNMRSLLTQVNGYLRRHLGRDRQIGHAELMRHKLEARRDERGWSDDADGRLRAVAYTLRTFLLPLLRDYFANDLSRVRVALGPWCAVVETVDDEAVSDDQLWLDDGEVLDDAGLWWDPTSDQWDAQRVRAALADVAK